MSYQFEGNLLGEETALTLSGGWGQYWIAFLRVLTGWWFFHSGVTKLIADGLNYTYAPAYLEGMSSTVVGPLATFLATDAAWLVKAGVPLFETLIGLALLFGVLTRLAAFGGVFFMTLFWTGNAEFGHGLVNGDLMGLLLFMTMIVFAAGRYYGLDAIIEKTAFIKQHPRLRYLLG
ncbi:DoxX family membrane protein [Halobellus rubicundus]|uniref:DoxX family membrane protein n=1 Tax=Halobellus rubicundus TaxID=2996466 RepID=A0ABD5MG70_9EURY